MVSQVIDIMEIKALVKAEMSRRNAGGIGYGDLSSFATDDYDYNTSPTTGEGISHEHYEKLMDPLLNVNDFRRNNELYSKNSQRGISTYEEAKTYVNTLKSIAANVASPSESGCRGACSGLCAGSCAGQCIGCTSTTTSGTPQMLSTVDASGIVKNDVPETQRFSLLGATEAMETVVEGEDLPSTLSEDAEELAAITSPIATHQSSSCGGVCTASCAGGCASSCEASCLSESTYSNILIRTDDETNTKVYSVATPRAGCQAACDTTCSGMCKFDCYGICKSDCQITCKGTCDGECQGTCTSACARACSSGCSGSCTSCSGTCKGGCSGTCSSCSAGCSGGCSGSCSGTCSSTCTGTCKGTCKNSCQNGCSSGCQGECKNSCHTTCSTTCLSTCTGTCFGEASSPVTKYL